MTSSRDPVFDLQINGRAIGDYRIGELEALHRDLSDEASRTLDPEQMRNAILVEQIIEHLTMTDRDSAEDYRNQQIQKILDLFEGANGKPPTSVEELEKWAASPEGRAAMAYDTDTRGKIIPL